MVRSEFEGLIAQHEARLREALERRQQMQGEMLALELDIVKTGAKIDQLRELLVDVPSLKVVG